MRWRLTRRQTSALVFELGDAWHPGWSRPDQLAAQRLKLEAIAAKAGRDAARQDITLLRPMQILDRPADGPRRALIGTAEQVAKDLRAYEQVGVNHLALGLPTSNGQEI
jgi:alkanesulfonate monooxygenase SsuD/methylene tetrahydromethanopterin reductase-like flavin-dependent oxidoreductase (luciferase family)